MRTLAEFAEAPLEVVEFLTPPVFVFPTEKQRARLMDGRSGVPKDGARLRQTAAVI